MSHPGIGTCARRALLISVLACAASAQMNFYVGDGYVTELGPAESGAVAIFDAGGDGVLDLAHLAAGALMIHERFAEHPHTFTVADVDACAVSHGTEDRLFGLSQGGLVEVVRDSSSWSALAVPAAGIASATLLRSSDRPLGPRLLVIDQAGERASVLAPENGFSTLFQVPVAAGDGAFRDLAVLDWNGDAIDDLAVVTTAGLRVYGAAGGLMFALPAAPQGAFLEVVSGADTQWGRDLLVYQYRETPTSASALLILNAFHVEVIHADVLKLSGVALADVDDSPLPELILPRGDQRSALILKQVPTASESAAIFAFDTSDVNAIDLGLGSSYPTAAPATAVADVDGDGDEDVLFADDRGLGLLMISAWFDADERRAIPQDQGATPGLVPSGGGYMVAYDLGLDVPPLASHVEVEVWFQPDLEVPTLVAAPVYTSVMPASEPAQSITFATESAGGVYHFLYRPVAPAGSPEPAFPVWVALWSPDTEVHTEVASVQPLVYAWNADFSDSLGGTVRRPMIDPGGGTGGTSIWQ